MLAGIWAAWKAISPLIRYGVIAGVIASLIAGWFGYQQYLLYKGRQQQLAKQNMQLRQQAQESTEEFQRQADIRQRNTEAMGATIATLQEELVRARQEIDHYAKKKVCPLDSDAVRIVNDLARVLNEPAAAQRVSAAGEATGESPVEAQAPVTAPDTAALIQRIADLTEREALTDAAHKHLSQYVLEKYEQEIKFYYGESGQ